MSSNAAAQEEGRGSDAEHGAHGEGGHIPLRTYVLIGVVLAVLMGIKVAIYYIPALDDVRTPILIALSTVKIALVVLFYMHLKVDHIVFTWVFAIGAALAAFMVGALSVIYHVLPRFHV